jgi:hypothetical protein
MEGLLWIVAIVGGLWIAFYVVFLPTIIAHKRGAESFAGIFVLNLLGFWPVAFLWACFGARRQPPAPPPPLPIKEPRLVSASTYAALSANDPKRK